MYTMRQPAGQWTLTATAGGWAVDGTHRAQAG